MTSLRKTVMGYITVLLIIVGIAAATTSYYFVKWRSTVSGTTRYRRSR